MFEEKATFMEKVANKTIEKDLLGLLKDKMSRVRNNIANKFRKLQ
jgi:hypothetical protein